MIHLHSTAASLRIGGDDLDPDEISVLLGCQPTKGYRKGQVERGPSSGRDIMRKTGAWMLDAEDQAPGNLDEQVRSILDRLPADLSIWKKLSSRYKIDLFCGWFMAETNEGIAISAHTLVRLGERAILLDVCIYAPLSGDKDGPKE